MRGFAIDLTDLVRRQAENVDATSKPPLPEAEAMTLQERFAELNDNPVPLTPGTLVTYKPGFEQRRPEWTGHPLIVADQDTAGYPLPKFAANSYVYRPDIAVLDLRPDGTAGIALLDRRWLKLWEPPPAIGPAPDPEAELNALKPEAIALFQTGHSARDVHRQLDVPLSLAARWVEEFRLAQTDEAARRLA
jgi:hypothetical protein